MIRTIQIRKKSYNWSDVLLIVLIVFNSGYAAANAVSATTIWITLMIPILLCIIKLHKRGILRRSITKLSVSKCLLLLPSVFILFSAITNLNIYTSIRPFMVIICAFFVSITYSFDEIKKGFQHTIIFICVVNLLVFIFDAIGLSMPSIQLVTKNGSIYQNGILFFKLYYGNNISDRYMGVFWEPGVFATFILLAITALDLSKRSWKSFILLSLYIISIYTTKSAAGYVIMPLAIMYVITKDHKNNKPVTLFINIFIVLLSVLALIQIDEIIGGLYVINPAVFGKIVNTDVASNYARIDSIKTNLSMFFEKPIFGYGVGEADLRYAQLTNSSQTSTSTYWLAVLGIFGVIPTFLLFRGVLKYRKDVSVLSKFIFLILYLLILNKEPHISNLCTTIIVFALNCIDDQEATIELQNPKIDLTYD